MHLTVSVLRNNECSCKHLRILAVKAVEAVEAVEPVEAAEAVETVEAEDSDSRFQMSDFRFRIQIQISDF